MVKAIETLGTAPAAAATWLVTYRPHRDLSIVVCLTAM